MKRRLFVPPNNRCCITHLIKNRLFEDDLLRLRVLANSSLVEVNDRAMYIDWVTVHASSSIKEQFGHYDLSAERLKVFTDLTWEQVETLRDKLHTMTNTEGRSVMQALVIFLYKMRSGSSNDAVAAIFDLPRAQQVSDIVDSVMNSFERDVLPFHFGFTARSTGDLMETEISSFFKRL